MTKQELNELLDTQLDECVFDNVGRTIWYVYQNYPGLSDDPEKRKKQMRGLYRNLGWVIFLDMYPRARKTAEEREKMEQYLAMIENLKRSLDFLKGGGR